MTIHRTTDEEKIRIWVEENGGRPAVVSDDTAGDNNGSLTLIFGEDSSGFREIEWQEFFDTLISSGLRFRFDDSLPKEDAEWAFGFEGRNEATDSSDETELPEDIDYIDENMFPSAPAQGM